MEEIERQSISIRADNEKSNRYDFDVSREGTISSCHSDGYRTIIDFRYEG